MMFRTRVLIPVCIAATGSGLLAGCAGSGSSNGSAGSGSGAVPTPTSDAVSAQMTSLGTVLVDGRGRTVYVFANDGPNKSNCDQSCAVDWPPVAAPTPLPSTAPGVTGRLGTAPRPDGSSQLTVAGHPVYRFSGDSAAGQTHGQGITLNGGLWTVVSPAGRPEPHPAGATAPAGGPVY
jgi:predicted lipoprotein with Yx(FWY)xxD motif